MENNIQEQNVDVTTQKTQVEGQKQDVHQEEGQNQEKTFSQTDVNNLVAKESKKATEKLLKELGIDDFENAKDGLKKFREYQESQKTEAEKKEDELNRLKNENAEFTKENGRLSATISALKSGVKAESVDDVILLAQKEVSEEVGIDEAIKKVIEKYPLFAGKEEKKETPPRFTSGSNHTNKDKTDIWESLRDKYK